MNDKKITLKFVVTIEADTSMILGDTNEEKIENYKNAIEKDIFISFDNYENSYINIKCNEASIEDY